MEKSNAEMFVEAAVNGALDIHIAKEAGSGEIKIEWKGGACGILYGLAHAQADIAERLERDKVITAVKVLDLLHEMASSIIYECTVEETPKEPGSDFLQAMGGADHE